MKKLRLFPVVTLVFLLLIQAGCLGSEPIPSLPVTTVPQSEETSIMDESERPLLSDALVRNCGRNEISGGFGRRGLVEGDTAIDFTLKDIHGNKVSLSGLLSEKPVVMIFGSFT